MLLTLDIGNTRAKLVSFLDGRPRPEAVCAVAELSAALAQIGARCPSIEAVHWCSVGADIAAVEPHVVAHGVGAFASASFPRRR